MRGREFPIPRRIISQETLEEASRSRHSDERDPGNLSGWPNTGGRNMNLGPWFCCKLPDPGEGGGV